MSANPIDKNSTPKPTGSLEELFRHHLGDEAAVPPRPVLWDQIDNSLLIRQNETYRRRLAATRWVAAASLLLATLAGAGWWATREARFGGAATATVAAPADATLAGPAASGTTGSTSAQPTDARGVTMPVGGRARDGAANNRTYAASGSSATNPGLEGQTSTATAGLTAAGSASRTPGVDAGRPAVANTTEIGFAGSADAAVAGVHTAAPRARFAQPETGASGRLAATMPARTADGGLPAAGATGVAATAASGAVALGAATPAATGASAAAMLEPAGLLVARSAALVPADLAGLPSGLAPVAVPAEASPAAVAAHKWRFSAGYTAGAFNPNINFSRAGIAAEYDYNPALGSESPALTETAAAQYRANLRPGFSQRLALLATRHLGGHWSLATGAELGQATATSAAASTFIGEQLFGGAAPDGPLRTSSFRYRTAGIPVAVRYANPAKRGWSLYGHLGGVVSALLGVRSEVAGSPEATRTYSLLSAGTPYRRMLGSVRGGAGAQFRPATRHWALTLGPVAELGLVPLNAHPAQSVLAQSRPYSFGVEAGVEFGR